MPFSLKTYKNILWDFDGVIIDSMEVRDLGFELIFKDFDKDKIDELIQFHRQNGGWSRYVKIRYFFEEILKTTCSESLVEEYAEKFSIVMREKLIKTDYLIEDSISFIKQNKLKFNFHIVSGSDDVELNFLCKSLKLDTYFHSIHGSPTPKSNLVKNLIDSCGYEASETCLIGDSINDFEAAQDNGISFFGYNNPRLRSNQFYIESFNESL